jgi:murein DD-endopeptidase MepM/ murein hydrolase activator NlpD
LTNTETITDVGTPTPTPTPVPRTVMVPTDMPDYTLAQDHFWFDRPFTDEFATWGSYYYPYGTNGRGQYFWHRGIDIQNLHGTPIVAVGPGTVVYAGLDVQLPVGPWPDFYGQAVIIEHVQRWKDQPVYTLYGHVSQVLVNQGQQVETGQPIAEVGQMGVALGPHLHLEVRVGDGLSYDDTRNPDFWVKPDRGFGVIAGRVVDYQNYFVPQQLVTLHRANEPGRFWRQTFTYPDNVVNADDDYGETFTFSDVPAGEYLVKTFFDGRQLTVPITVTNQATTFVLLRQTEPPPQIPTPTPEVEQPAADVPPEGQPPPEGEQSSSEQ